ncbi:MAG TPA: M28 family peptidase [Bryobacteraceae bacterium]|jgi:hypothetical protein|nr:M28 family peptidase [Bryobacteraceae bacterium]
MRVLACLVACAAISQAQSAVDSAKYLERVRVLSGENMRGRGTGSPELEKAARYLAAEFKRIGLQPAFAEGHKKSYLQPFEVSLNARLGPGCEFAVNEGSGFRDLTLYRDFLPFTFSGAGKVEGNAVFAGYGITAHEYGYDDYAGLDVQGKVVVILRHEPQEYDSRSVFDGRVYTEHSQLLSKVRNARLHGASGVVFVNDMGNHSGEDNLERFHRYVSPEDAGVPFVHVKSEIVEKWVAAAGRDLKQLQTLIDRDLTPQSFALPESLKLRIHVPIERERRVVHNVAAYLPGTSNEFIIIGAHYDHLGMGLQYSLSPSEAGKTHPGADDNASGTAGLVALAESLSEVKQRRRGVLFLAFAGEEIGLLGSSHYVQNPLLPNRQAIAMINMDMIGRIREGKVYVGGTGTGDNLRQMLSKATEGSGFDFDYSETAGYGSSDHTSFTTQEIPVLFFFSGLHEDYHRPTDRWEKINAPGAAQLLDVIGKLVVALSEAPERTHYVRAKPRLPTSMPVAGEGTHLH